MCVSGKTEEVQRSHSNMVSLLGLSVSVYQASVDQLLSQRRWQLISPLVEIPGRHNCVIVAISSSVQEDTVC